MKIHWKALTTLALFIPFFYKLDYMFDAWQYSPLDQRDFIFWLIVLTLTGIFLFWKIKKSGTKAESKTGLLRFFDAWRSRINTNGKLNKGYKFRLYRRQLIIYRRRMLDSMGLAYALVVVSCIFYSRAWPAVYKLLDKLFVQELYSEHVRFFNKNVFHRNSFKYGS